MQSKTNGNSNGDLLQWVLSNLTDCCAELVVFDTHSWVSDIPAGSFYIYCIREGNCFLRFDDGTPSIRIPTGGAVVLPQCKSHHLAGSDGISVTIPRRVSFFEETDRANKFFGQSQATAIKTKLLACRFRMPRRETNLLFEALPTCIMIRNHDTSRFSDSESTIELMIREIERQHPDRERVLEYLAKVLILQATRAESKSKTVPSVKAAHSQSDPIIIAALGLIHSRPDLSWTVASLAAAVGVSRSTFAARFASRVGLTPVSYLRRERMQQAAELLRDETLGIKEIAIMVGYDSESAFSNAFKLWAGLSPGSFRRDPK